MSPIKSNEVPEEAGRERSYDLPQTLLYRNKLEEVINTFTTADFLAFSAEDVVTLKKELIDSLQIDNRNTDAPKLILGWPDYLPKPPRLLALLDEIDQNLIMVEGLDLGASTLHY